MPDPAQREAVLCDLLHLTGDNLKDYARIYKLLERFSMNEILRAYGKKYPEGVSGAESIKQLNWSEIENRLKEAVLNPNKIFRTDLAHLLPKNDIKPARRNRKPKI